MSTLTWVLLILAVVVIGGVLIFNSLQGRKSKSTGSINPATNAAGQAKKITVPDKTLTPYFGDVKTGTESLDKQSADAIPTLAQTIDPAARAEPSLGGEFNLDNATIDHADNSLSHSPIFSADLSVDPEEDKVVAEVGAKPELPPSVLNENFDYLIEFALAAPQSGERLIALTAQHRRAGAKPLAFDGLLTSGSWIALAPGYVYSAIRAGILLANRGGPLNAMEFSDFGNLTQELATQLDCDAVPKEMRQVLNQARDLDRRCGELDAQLGITVQTALPVSQATLEAVATSQGLVERGNGRFAKLDSNSATLFTLAFAEFPDRLTMLLDVPRAPANQQPWQQLIQCAAHLCEQLDGQLIDDSGKPLPEQFVLQIEDHLRQRYWALEAAGIIAGSPQALRLFN